MVILEDSISMSARPPLVLCECRCTRMKKVVTRWRHPRSTGRDSSNTPTLPTVRRKCPHLAPTTRNRAGPRSIPLAVVAGSTFLLAADLRNILQVEDRRPSLGCWVVADIRTVLVARTGPRRPRSVAGMVRFGFAVVVILGLASRMDQRRSGFVEGRWVADHSGLGICNCQTYYRSGSWDAGLQRVVVGMGRLVRR